MGRIAIGIDVGSENMRLVAGEHKKDGFHVLKIATAPGVKDKVTDPHAVAAAVREALDATGLKGQVAIGLTGRDVVVRYTQVPQVPEWQLKNLMNFEIQELIQQSGDALAADYNLIPVASDVSSDDTVLLALAKETLLDAQVDALKGSGGDLVSFQPNSIALYNAYRKAGAEDGVTLLVNISARNTDIAVTKDGDLLFARNLSGGGDLFDEALVAAFNVSRDKARSLKEQFANVSPFDVAKRSAQEDKVSRALAGATGQILSMVQSSILFARSQTGQNELKPSRVLLSGGTARMRGLDKYIESNLNVPVTAFDPYAAMDTSAVEAELDDSARAGAVVALGLALGAAGVDVYSIQILPAAVRKGREFKEKTVWIVAAALALVAWLGVDAYLSKQNTDAALADDRLYAAELDKRTRAKKNYEDGVALRAAQASQLSELEARVVPGVGLERALTLLQKHLPLELYVRSVQVDRLVDANLGIPGPETRPVVVIRGEGREGAQGVETRFNAFVQALAADPLLPRTPVTSTKPQSGKAPFEWTVTLNFSKPSGAAADVAADTSQEKN
jgi:type IV pilus assembly protein PilM